MKQTQTNPLQTRNDLDYLIDVLAAKDLVNKKVRVNLYLSKVVMHLMNALAKNVSRGEWISTLILKEAQARQRRPYGMFSPTKITQREINEIAAEWEKTVDDLA